VTYSVTVRRLAEQDLLEAQRWYDEQRTGLGTEFRAAVSELLNRLADAPFAYPIVHQQHVRRAVLRRFPYLVYFAASDTTVTVLACLHSSRDPRLAQERSR
jgi:plasmid stabilization system protein ParE